MSKRAKRIASHAFVDGVERAMNREADGRQYVIHDDKEYVYGVLILDEDTEIELPIAVSSR